MIKQRLQSLKFAFTSWPNAIQWSKCAAVYAAFSLLAGALGFSTGFLKIELMNATPRMFAIIPVLIFIRPALIEETVFRGAFVPHVREERSRASVVVAAVLSLMVFVAMHPLNGMFFKTAAYGVYIHPIFLSSAALLGLACTIAYRISGSLWPPIAMHWMTVVCWTVFFGGKRLLTGQ